MKHIKLISLLLAGSVSASASADIFVSEYIEGSSNNKALEIYNSGENTIDISQYKIELYSNGSESPSATYSLTGSIASGGVHVIGHPSAEAAVLSVTNQTIGLNYNGDDAFILKNDQGDVIDAFGQIGFRPDGGSWNINGVRTKDRTLRRKSAIISGDAISGDAFDPSIEWTEFAQNTYDGLGSHTIDGSDPVDPVDPTPPVNGEIVAPCLNCPNLLPVADPDTFDANALYANIAQAIADMSDSPTPQELSDVKALINDAAQSNQKILTYAEVWSALTATDEDRGIPDAESPNSDNIRLFYSGRSIPKTENASAENANEDDFWNREHTWPSSHGFGSNIRGAYTDIHHLRPSDRSVNASRSDKDYDFGGTELGEALGNYTDNDSFEPRDDVKGDVARQLFYMDTRYEGEQSDETPDLSLVNRLTDSTENVVGKLCVLIQWHTNDPVSTEEMARHDLVYQYQGNRNPYIDNPSWADVIYPAVECDQVVDPVDPVDPIDPVDPVDPIDPPTTNSSPLILSTVFDGSLSGGLPKGVEIYVAQDIPDLSICGIGSANNGGGSDGQEFTFPANVSASAGSFIYIASKVDGFETYFGIPPDYTDNAMSINGDDAIELFCNGEVVDLYGDINVDGTGEAWEYLDSFAKRVNNTAASATFNADNWVFAGKNVLDGNANGEAIGLGEFELVLAELFISEYAEGGGFNKVIEIVNVTGRTIDLSNYYIDGYQNGASSPSYSIPLEGILASQSVFVLANPDANLPIISGLVQTSSQLAFNGDDSVVLMSAEGVIDAIGQIGVDPGSEWGTGLVSTKDNTIRRKEGITVGDTNATDEFDPSTEWDGFAKDDLDDIGLYYGIGGDDGVDPVVVIGECGVEASFIHEVQGSDDIAALNGQTVVVEGVVTLVAENMSGFFMQEEDADHDNDPNTSEGLFVYINGDMPSIAKNDVVRVLGEVTEFYNKTQIEASQVVASCGTSVATALTFELPLSDTVNLESMENMLVSSIDDLVVTGTRQYARLGELVVASERLFTPTHLYLPGSAEAIALTEYNANNQFILDDLADGLYNAVDTLGEFTPYNSPRTGSIVMSSEFIIDYGFSNYRLRPVASVNYVLDPRPAAPQIEGNIKVASYNVLNLFNGNGSGSGFEDSRGAEEQEGYLLQRDKIVQALIAIDASVIGLMEIENDGYDELSSIAQLVDALNAAYGENVYAFVDAGVAQGTDAISVGILYNSTLVNPTGSLQVLNSENSIADDQGPLFDTSRNRPSFAQMFSVLETGDTFVVNVNHLKSKGSSCGADDDDAVNGQGSCNLTRTRAAQALHIWLASTFPDEAIMIMGDLNSYGQEDPIVLLNNAGYTDMAREFHGPKAYSYTFDNAFGSLDYVMANAKAKALIQDVAEWHINADEHTAFDYNADYALSSNVAKPSDVIDTSEYRSSDHDPVVIGLSFEAAMLGDVDDNDILDFTDYRIIAALIGASQGDDNFVAAADIDQDGEITLADTRAWYKLYVASRRAIRGR